MQNIPSGYSILIGGHSPITVVNSTTGIKQYGLSSFSSSDIPQDGLTLDGVLNDAINDGVNVIAYISGHRHADNVWTLNNSEYPNIIFNCDVMHNGGGKVQNELGNPESYNRKIGDISEYSINICSIDSSNKIFYNYRFGVGYDRMIYSENREVRIGETLDLTSIIGTTLSYSILDTSLATISNGIVTGVSRAHTQGITTDINKHLKIFISLNVI